MKSPVYFANMRAFLTKPVFPGLLPLMTILQLNFILVNGELMGYISGLCSPGR